MLPQLASGLKNPGATLARWRELDLSVLAPLIEGYRALARRYEEMDTGEGPPSGRELLKEVKGIKVGRWA
jgi:hypothetical protein